MAMNSFRREKYSTTNDLKELFIILNKHQDSLWNLLCPLLYLLNQWLKANKINVSFSLSVHNVSMQKMYLLTLTLGAAALYLT